MGSRKQKRHRKRIGRVSYYFHHNAWYLYYRKNGRPVRRRVADTEEAAKQIAAQVNSQLMNGQETPFAFSPVSITELRSRFLNYHENVRESSLATVRRYQSATQHLIDFVTERGTSIPAHKIDAEEFVAWLRKRKVSPNGHANTSRRLLSDKGLRFILEVCRSLYSYATKQRHLPPYIENPFQNLDIERMKIEDAKPIFVFNEASEFSFLQKADEWAFQVHFTLAKTGMRSGELVHLLIEDVDLENGWIFIQNKLELGWRIKTGRERAIPLVPELVDLLRQVIGDRKSGPVFLRHHFNPDSCSFANCDRSTLGKILSERIQIREAEQGEALSRRDRFRLVSSVWREVGAIKADRIRSTFIRTSRCAGLLEATCPKSWRHTFATLLQDANVDPLIRQITLGHKPSEEFRGGLGMTGVYTHTRRETQKREIERAIRLWPQSLDMASKHIR